MPKLSVGIETPTDHRGVLESIEHFKEFHKLMHVISETSPGLGLALKAAFSPVGAAIVAATFLLKGYIDHVESAKRNIEELEKAHREFADDMRESWNKVVDKVKDADTAYQDFLKHVSDDPGKLERMLDEKISRLNAMAEAVKKLVAALEAAGVTRGTTGDYGAEDVEKNRAHTELELRKKNIQDLKAEETKAAQEVESARAAQAAEANYNALDEASRKAATRKTFPRAGMPDLGPDINARINQPETVEQYTKEGRKTKQEAADLAAGHEARQKAADKALEEAEGKLKSFGEKLRQAETELEKFSTKVAIGEKSNADVRNVRLANELLLQAQAGAAGFKTATPDVVSLIQQTASMAAGKPVDPALAVRIIQASGRSADGMNLLLTKILAFLDDQEQKNAENFKRMQGRLQDLDSKVAAQRINVPGF